MHEYTADGLANRDEPIPVFPKLGDDYDEGKSEGDTHKLGKREKLKNTAKSITGIKNHGKSSDSSHSSSIQDRLVEKLFQQIIPVEDQGSNTSQTSPEDSVERPNFNITTMSHNFRRFNSRIGVVFVFQNKVARLMAWRQWSHTLSFLAIYTFICLDPYLVTVLPLTIALLAILIPSFITRHPAPPQTINTESFTYSARGPPMAPAPTVKPVKELSKDFFRNMRDLQNSMEDFSIIHDKIITIITPSTNFSNESLSSALFLFLFATSAVMFIASHLIPWRFIFLTIGWAITCLGHPSVKRQMMSTHKEHMIPHEEEAKSWVSRWISRDIILDSAPETREVEIFELQHLTLADEWEAWLFAPSPYDPLSSSRLSGSRPTGTRFFEDVQAPIGWEWSEKKWALDLWSREWVEDRIITGVEVETEGERWVYDIEYDGGSGSGSGERRRQYSGLAEPSNPRDKAKQPPAPPLPSWEEGDDSAVIGGVDGSEERRRGVWRRRRWVRMVKRKYQGPSSDRLTDKKP